MSGFKIGDRVKVSEMEGEVVSDVCRDGSIKVAFPDTSSDFADREFAWVLPERLTKVVPSQPKWQKGDLVLVDDGYGKDEALRYAPDVYDGYPWQIVGSRTNAFMQLYVDTAWEEGRVTRLVPLDS